MRAVLFAPADALTGGRLVRAVVFAAADAPSGNPASEGVVFAAADAPSGVSRRRPYSAFTAAVSSVRPFFASAKSIPVFGFV
ncbi:MAG: hypothetical protein KatS3mg065_1082 [Chloroflexota bacterium]|nr:MAG: hypothetical protein KatS3mg065_1082 [Chloroflexota bacterium]